MCAISTSVFILDLLVLNQSYLRCYKRVLNNYTLSYRTLVEGYSASNTNIAWHPFQYNTNPLQ